MPVISSSSFIPPRFLESPHLQTIVPALFRRVRIDNPKRERITTPDNDFLDLDWWKRGNSRLAILTHGLEGSSMAPYILGMARQLLAAGWDVLAWNFRGCSGEQNLLPRFYHSGESNDLRTVIMHVLSNSQYRFLSLIGISVGGNITLKYLGEESENISPRIHSAVALSTPCDLAASAEKLSKGFNRIYLMRFLLTLKQKIRTKAKRFPKEIDLGPLSSANTFREFDDAYTAPLNGFKDAAEYWQKCSSSSFVDKIRIPTLILTALDDPFLTPTCFPVDASRNSSFVFLETPPHGGHVGFIESWRGLSVWSEKRTEEFIQKIAPE